MLKVFRIIMENMKSSYENCRLLKHKKVVLPTYVRLEESGFFGGNIVLGRTIPDSLSKAQSKTNWEK